MIKAKIIEKGSPRMKAREYNALVKQTLKEVGEFWFHNMLPRHFEEGAGRRYGYTGRAGLYTKTKNRKVGHKKPLVFTGRMQRELQQSYRLGGTSNKMVVTMYGPPYTNMRRQKKKGGDPINKVAEITAVTKAEIRILEKEVERRLGLALNRDGSKTITTRI